MNQNVSLSIEYHKKSLRLSGFCLWIFLYTVKNTVIRYSLALFSGCPPTCFDFGFACFIRHMRQGDSCRAFVRYFHGAVQLRLQDLHVGNVCQIFGYADVGVA